MALVDSKARMRCTKLSSPSARLFRSSPNACECSLTAEGGGFVAVELNDACDVCEANTLDGDGETVRDLRLRMVGRGKKLKAADVEGNGREGWVGVLSIFADIKFQDGG